MNALTSSPRLRGLVATALVCAVVSSFATVCTAADNKDFPSVVVKFGDLNLSNPEGAAVLYRRIDSAAREVCKAYDISSGRYKFPPSSNPCVAKSIQEAVAKVGHPALLAIYNAKHPHPVPIEVASAGSR